MSKKTREIIQRTDGRYTVVYQDTNGYTTFMGGSTYARSDQQAADELAADEEIVDSYEDAEELLAHFDSL